MLSSVVACAGGEVIPPVDPPPPIASGPDPVPPPVDLSASWASSTPVAEGFDPTALEAAVSGAPDEVDNIRGIAVVRNGRLVREAYFGGSGPNTPHDMRSVTKTVMALVLGLAADDGFLAADDLMTDWITHASLRAEHAPIRVEDLLTMTSGMRWTDAGDFNPWVLSGRPVGYVLDQPVVAGPGQQFIYNTGGSHILSVIVAEAVGQNTLDFANEQLFAPLGIDNLVWLVMQDGLPTGGAGLALTSRDAAKIGQLLLQGGRSGSTQIISSEWVDAQLGRQVSLGGIGTVLTDAGYGYQTWHDRSGAGVGVEAYVMWGYGGQFVWIVPDRQLVVVAATHWQGVGAAAGQQAQRVSDIVRQIVASAEPITR